MATTKISRHLVRCGDRLVHLRRAGAGPAVLLLHESPSSSAMMLPLIEALADKCTVIAPDTPGNGQSDPLALDAPTMADYADALIELMDALGIQRAAALGLHTGGSCVVELAAEYPERLTVGVIGGLVAFPPSQRDELLARYFVDLTPVSSGAHMLHTWHRMRSQFTHFPWYDTRPETRMRVDLPPLELIHGIVMDLLQCAGSYRTPYAAAIAHDGAARLAAVCAPVAISAVRADGIYSHIHAVAADIKTPVSVAHLDTFPEARAWQIRQLLSHLPSEPAPPPTGAGWISGPSRLRLGPDGGTHARSWGNGNARPLVLLHAAGAASSQWEKAAGSLAKDHTVLAIDLPGHGLSASGDDLPMLEASVAALEQIVQELGWADCALYGEGLGARVAARLAENATARHRIVHGPQNDPLVPDQAALDRCTQLLEPHAWGEHLVAAWHIARDAALFERWDRPIATGLLNADGEALTPAAVQTRAIDFLLARQGLTMLGRLPAVHSSQPSQNNRHIALPSYRQMGSPGWLKSFSAAIG